MTNPVDHFLFYDTSRELYGERVKLKTQFDLKPDPLVVNSASKLGTSVQKNGEEWHQRRALLSWYDLLDRSPDSTKRVLFKNQFGKQRAVLGRKVALLTPDDRNQESDHRRDHYVVLEVLRGRDVDRKVVLQDRWEKTRTVARCLRYFAAPAIKWHRAARPVEVDLEGPHLAIYEIDPRTLKQRLVVSDQFGKRSTRIHRSVLLGVPSTKQSFEETD